METTPTTTLINQCPVCLGEFDQEGTDEIQAVCPCSNSTVQAIVPRVVPLSEHKTPRATISYPVKQVIWWCTPCRSQWDESTVAEHEGMCPHNCGNRLQAMSLTPIEAPLPVPRHISSLQASDKIAGVLAFMLLVDDTYHMAIQNGAHKLHESGYPDAQYQTQNSSCATFWLLPSSGKVMRVSATGLTAVVQE